jgi:hypothetical protein
MQLMDFRRVDALPPYAFAEVERLKLELRRAGEDVIDLGFGNPDVAPPDVAVEKLREAALLPRNHRYSASRGITNLRRAVADLYERRFGVELDPERGAITTIGAKEGLSQLMWLLVEPGDVALVPDPSARTLVFSFPHNPTGAVATPELIQRIVDAAREHELLVVHDFAYADLAYDGHEPPWILQAEGAREVAIELYVSRARPASTSALPTAKPTRQPAMGEALCQRLGHLPADPDGGDRRHQRSGGLPPGSLRDLLLAARHALPRARTRRLAGRAAEGDDVRLGADPGPVPRRRLARRSRCAFYARQRWPSAPASGSARPERGTFGSRSSRTSSGSPRRSAESGHI